MESGDNYDESNNPSTEEREIDPHLINYVRLAIAVAIIKIKPPDQSAQLYTEQLCIQFRHIQLQWKSKMKELREKVAKLEEKLGQKSAPIQTQKDITSCSEDLQIYPTPPCSAECLTVLNSLPIDKADVPTEQALFMNSVLALSNISVCSPNEINIPVHAATAEAALVNLGDILTRSASAETCISQTLLQHMSQVIINLVENRCGLPVDFVDVLHEKVLRFVWGITTALLVCDSQQRCLPDCLSDVVVLLSGSRALRPAIVRMLTGQLGRVAEHLRAVCTSDTRLNESLYQNSYHIFHSIEQVLEADILRKDNCLGILLCREVFSALDDCLLHVWERSPPFAQYARHLQGLLQCLHPDLLTDQGGESELATNSQSRCIM